MDDTFCLFNYMLLGCELKSCTMTMIMSILVAVLFFAILYGLVYLIVLWKTYKNHSSDLFAWRDRMMKALESEK